MTRDEIQKRIIHEAQSWGGTYCADAITDLLEQLLAAPAGKDAGETAATWVKPFRDANEKALH